MRVIVYEYGLRQPTSGIDDIDDQIHRAHRYYNKLIEIERWRRAQVKKAQLQVPEVANTKKVVEALREDLEALRTQHKRAKSHDGKTHPPRAGAIKDTTAALKAARQGYRQAKKDAADILKPLYKKVDEERNALVRQARGESGVYWGTYLCIEQFASQAAQTAKRESPDFRRWTGDGMLAVQIQNGLDAGALFGDDTRVQVAPIDSKAWDKSISRGKRKRMQYTTLRLRVGSTGPGNREPVWAEWPLFMHRELPADASIKWVRVIRRRWDQRWKYRWVVQFTVEVPEAPGWQGEGTRKGMVAINLGWRKLATDALRVATWVDTEGNVGELQLPVSFRQRLEKANSIRSIRDRKLDELKAAIVPLLPECSRWKSPKRFEGLLRQDDLPDGVRDLVNKWAYRDRHLWWFERGCRQGALRYRREIYRLFALEMAKKYPLVIVEDYDLRPIVTDENRIKLPSHQRVEGSPSEARHVLLASVSRLGGMVIDGKSKLATQECHLCGYGKEKDERWDASPKIEHTCVGCGENWDQDVNNARVLLARAQVMLESGELLAQPKPKRSARFAKKHKKQNEAVL